MIKYGFTEHFSKQVKNNENETLTVGRVIGMQRESYTVITEKGQTRGRLKGAVYYNDLPVEYPSVGDFVLIAYNEGGESIIHWVLERKSKFTRFDSFKGKSEVVASNFDYVFIMMSMNKDFNLARLDRYLSQSWESGAEPVVLLTKSDIAEDADYYIEKVNEHAPFATVLPISTYTGDGLEEVMKYFTDGKTIVFLGSSGVGKSTLVNRLAGEEVMDTSGIREDDSRGRHTTTKRELLMLPGGAMVIDTPGMRSLGIYDAENGVGNVFSDIEELAKGCKFTDCRHESEPGCNIKRALQDGTLAEDRWRSYKKLLREAEYTHEKARKKGKEIAKFSKALRKSGYGKYS